MLVKRFLDKLRAKGYDDFYMVNMAGKYEDLLFLFIGALPILVMAGIVNLFNLRALPILAFAMTSGVLLIMSLTGNAGIRSSKNEGKTDLRSDYIIYAFVSRLLLKIFRYAPVISIVLTPIILIVGIVDFGFHWSMLLSTPIGIGLLLILSPSYHKLLSQISKEAAYYVDWKTNNDVEHFEEIYSRHEKWWLSEAEMGFEKFNVDHFRSIRLVAFIGAFASPLAGFILALSFSPIFFMPLY